MSLPRRALPPLNSLRAFEVAGRRRSFRAAAEELGVTQGAVAQQVRVLEDHLGLPLLQRLARGLALTPQGAGYWVEVTRAFDTLIEATRQLLARPRAVTISVTPGFATRLLIPQLPALLAAHPGIGLRIVATEAVSDLEGDQVDIALRLTRPPFPSAHEARRLFRREPVPVASPHLPGLPPLPLTARQKRELPLLHDAHGHWPRCLDASRRLPGAVSNQTAHALDAALAGQGIAIACRAFAQADLDAGRLVQVAPASPPRGPDYVLIRQRIAAPPRAVTAVRTRCLDQWGMPRRPA